MTIHAEHSRRFALDVVRKLRDAGFKALWAGGCVRDELMGIVPKDYDVATNATPDDVSRVFGRKRTIGVGAAFGVMIVLGPKSAGQVEVATFRQDADYSDGRRPDSVTFSTAEQDALRRDFTINGLFFDPVANKLIDYVNGRADIDARIIRAIGDPYERIREDKLRMLRAVRFAATFQFELDPGTLAAIQKEASTIGLVSAERIANELSRMLLNQHRTHAVCLLRQSQLLSHVLPEMNSLADDAWRHTEALLEALDHPTLSVAFAALLFKSTEICDSVDPAVSVCRRLKLSNYATEGVVYLLKNWRRIVASRAEHWPRLQRLLVTERIGELVAFASTLATVNPDMAEGVRYSQEKLALPENELNPPPLISGNDLKQAGIQPGPNYRVILDAVRDAQLEKDVTTREQALEMAKTLATEADQQPSARFVTQVD